VPIFATLEKPESSGVRAIVLAPTRELAQQIFRELSRLGKDLGFNIHFLTHKMITEYHLNKHSNVDIVVTTPLRLTHMLNSRASAIDLSK
jgi:ATP-dependent RNA helicase DDX52/ROK1